MSCWTNKRIVKKKKKRITHIKNPSKSLASSSGAKNSASTSGFSLFTLSSYGLVAWGSSYTADMSYNHENQKEIGVSSYLKVALSTEMYVIL